jgi:predicted RNase H-like HicB family nuclease
MTGMNALSLAEAHRMDRAYRVILEPEPDKSAYNVTVPAFPKAHTWGSTVAEALTRAREVIELEIEDRQERGEPVPPGDVDTLVVETVTIPSPVG